MFQALFRDRALNIMALLSIIIKFFSLNEAWVEKYYTHGIYPGISSSLRWLFGWIPFSVGDLFYAAATVYLVYALCRMVSQVAKTGAKKYFSLLLARKVLKISLAIYIVFNAFWGLNYNRIGIAGQLGLKIETHSKDDLLQLTRTLGERLCFYGDKVDSSNRASLNNNLILFNEGVVSFAKVKARYPFLNYAVPSIKTSLLTPVGRYFGFTGYYNPFSAEAQLKTSVPVFVKPFVLCHEIAHQLGYAKENEANLVSFLVGRESTNMEFRYSVYFDMYTYALGELAAENRNEALLFIKTAHPQFLKDRLHYITYLQAQENPVEPVMSRFYDRFLKINNQPKGKGSYNQVVTWLIAYMKKYGVQSV
jgi:hypothetical protein